jgi:hypothetical protein
MISDYWRQPGTVLGFTGQGFVSWLIETWTGFPESHVAVIVRIAKSDLSEKMRSLNDHWIDGLYLVECTTLCKWPCMVQHIRFSGTQVQNINTRVLDYQGKASVIVPVTRLDDCESKALTAKAVNLIGTPYSVEAAALAGTHIIKRFFVWVGLAGIHEFCVKAVGDILQAAIGYRWGYPTVVAGGDCPGLFMRELVYSGLFLPPVSVHQRAGFVAKIKRFFSRS